MNTQLVPVTLTQDAMALAGMAANTAAAHNVLIDYQARKSQETLRRQKADITLFAHYLAAAGVLIDDLTTNLESWSGITYGLVDGFTRWQLQQGYAIGSINVRLASVKTYAELSAKAGYIPGEQLTMIKTVRGIKGQEGRNVDEKRTKAGTRTRQERAKKAEPVSISLKQARALKQQPDTKKGRRDSLLMCLLLDLGLRVGEISDLNVSAIDLRAGTLTFYRHKVDKTQILNLTEDTLESARLYLEQQQLDQDAPLFAGPCSGERISERTMNARLAVLGERVGISDLSPHDCRHYWATNAVRSGTDIKRLQDAGGWSSPAMPLRYAESSRVANDGVKLTV